MGDFDEIYNNILQEKGSVKANIWYVKQILKSCPSFIVYSVTWKAIMFKSYIKTAFRTIKRDLFYSLINITSLSVGLACTIGILIFIQNELSFDRFHNNKENIYRVVTKSLQGGGNFQFSPSTMAPLAVFIENEARSNLKAVRLKNAGKILVRYDDKVLYENGLYWADRRFFEIFSFELLLGVPEEVLTRPNSLVITQSTSNKYFGDENPVGKTMLINNENSFVITGVVKDPPFNSSIIFNILGSFNSPANSSYSDQNWRNLNLKTFVSFSGEWEIEKTEKYLNDLVESNSFQDFSDITDLLLQPLQKIHLYQSDGSPGLILVLYSLAAVGFIILIIAVFNYINLSTARLVKRSSEIGMRKVIGADSSQIITQYLFESTILALIALPIAFGALKLSQTPLNNFIGSFASRQIIFNISEHPYFLASVICMTGLIGIAAGIYSAFILSRLQLRTVTGKTVTSGKGMTRIRKTLVTVQFVFTVFFFICTIIMYEQVDFLRKKDLGYNSKSLISIHLENDEARDTGEILKNELLNNPEIINASLSYSSPARLFGFSSRVYPEGSPNSDYYSMHMFAIDEDFIETFGMEIVTGSNIPESSEGFYLINETAVRYFNWNDPVGRQIQISGTDRPGMITGVVKDFHFLGMQSEIEPALLYYSPAMFKTLTVNTGSNNIPAVIDQLRKEWNKYLKGYPFEYSLFEEESERLFLVNEIASKAFNFYSIFAIVIACLGLYGLVAYSAENRRKEISIRKVLGAGTSGTAVMLLKEYIKLVIIAIVIASPGAYFAMTGLLQNFAYRIPVRFVPFVAASLIVLMITVLTIIYHTIKIARTDPAEALRNE